VATEIGFTGIAVPPDFAACHCVQANGLAGAENELFFSWEVADDPQNPPSPHRARRTYLQHSIVSIHTRLRYIRSG
jgi:hypothetical protein